MNSAFLLGGKKLVRDRKTFNSDMVNVKRVMQKVNQNLCLSGFSFYIKTPVLTNNKQIVGRG